MSASREKKARQTTGKELTEKQKRALAAQKKAKQKTMLYSIGGAVCAVLVAALLIWNSGFFQARVPALTINGKSYSAADVQYHYTQVASEWYLYAQYGMLSNLNPELPADEQMYDENKTWHEEFLDSAVELVTQYKLLYEDAKKAGVELNEENRKLVAEEMTALQETAASNGYASAEGYLKALYGKYMTLKNYEQLVTETHMVAQYVQAFGDSKQYSDQELEDYYTEHKQELDLYQFGYVYFDGNPEAKKDADGNTIEATETEIAAAKDAAKEKAEELQKELNKGTSYEDATAKYESDSKVTVTSVLGHPGSGVNSAFKEWVQDDSRKKGDVNLVENSTGTGFYVVWFESSGRDTEISGDVRTIFVKAELSSGATTPTEEQYDAAKKKAEELLAQWKKDGATEDAFIALAKKESADTATAENGGLLEQVTTTQNYSSDFANWVVESGRKNGDTAVLKDNRNEFMGYQVVYYVGQNKPLWKIDVHNTMASNATSEWIDGMIDSAEVVQGNGLKYVG